MPSSVIRDVGADHVRPAAELGRLVGQLCRSDGSSDGETSEDRGRSAQVEFGRSLIDLEVGMAEMNGTTMNEERPEQPSGFSCPNCNGTLFEIHDAGMVRYRCRVGHAWSSRGLLAEQSDSLDRALWMALRSLEEKAALNRELADRATERGNKLSAHRYRERAEETARSAAIVRELLEQPLSPRAEPLAEPAEPSTGQSMLQLTGPAEVGEEENGV